MSKSIDLGMSHGGPKMDMVSKWDEEYYPEFEYSGEKPLDLPDEGVMKIRYRKVRSSERLVGEEKVHTCTVEVMSIESVKGVKEDAESDMPVKNGNETEDALDNLMREKAEKEY